MSRVPVYPGPKCKGCDHKLELGELRVPLHCEHCGTGPLCAVCDDSHSEGEGCDFSDGR